MNKVLVAMSGGVDSSVAAALLVEKGYDVFGVTLHLTDSEDIPANHRPCCITEDVNDARKVCQILGIPHYVFDFKKYFEDYVVGPSCQEYARGRTPNPCLACNEHIKFSLLLNKALSLGAYFIATGHYAQVQKEEGHFKLIKAKDQEKDQSYFLYCLGQEELCHLLLPLGLLTKTEVRQIAKMKGFPVAAKRDSQDLCFVPDGDLKSFLKKRLECRPGYIIDPGGNTIGKHDGIAFYTVGQRLHINPLPGESKRRLYVLRILTRDNILVAGKEEDLFSRVLKAAKVNWVKGNHNLTKSRVLLAEVKIRYGSAPSGALIYLNSKDRMFNNKNERGEAPFENFPPSLLRKGRGTKGEGLIKSLNSNEEVTVSFLQPQRAITPGQAAVFYQGEEVIGGGTILESGR